LIALVIFIQVMGGAQPEIKVQPLNTMSMELCEKYVANSNKIQPTELEYDVKGRPILQAYHECMPMTQTMLRGANELLQAK
jgi:hypothetical protein